MSNQGALTSIISSIRTCGLEDAVHKLRVTLPCSADRDPVASVSLASGSTTRTNSAGPSSAPRTKSADPSSTSSTHSGDSTNQTNPSRTNKNKIGVGPIVGGVIAAVVVLALAAGIILWRNRRKTSGIPIGDSENGSPTSAPIKPHTQMWNRPRHWKKKCGNFKQRLSAWRRILRRLHQEVLSRARCQQ
jgi:hypothetical protein